MSPLPRIGRSAPKELSEPPRGLRIRKLADYSEGLHTRVTRYHPETGEKFIADAKTGENRPWPLLGVVFEHDAPPQSVNLPTTVFNQGRLEGWIVPTELKVVHRPGGPPANPWAVTHTFEQCEELTFKLVDGDVRYKVVHNPDKYVDQMEPSGTRVDWFYLLERTAS